MDWAEELKMSIRKTTARKGRRSKSRDLLKDSTTGNSTTNSSAVATPNAQAPINKEISIDITLDLQNSDTIGATSTTATPHSSSTDTKRPPVRRISGGWADTGPSVLKSSKSKKGTFDDDRFQQNAAIKSISPPIEDDIPVIPDLDDVKDEVLLNEIVEPPSISVNRVVTLKELNSDLLSQNAFSGIEDVDLTILTRCLQAQESLDEADEIWDWEKVFTDVVAEINADKPNTTVTQKIELRPDEVPPPIMHV